MIADLKRKKMTGKDDDKSFIEVRELSKHFGEFVAVDAVDLRIERGELFSILGGSGCGKTTLLRMLAGFETPTSGRIFLDGVDITDQPPYERPVNMMFQSYAVFPHMTVEQNLGFPLKIAKEKKDVIKEKVTIAAEMLGLTEKLHQKPSELSGGQRQRVALGRAIIRKPDIFLLDEPLSNLDAEQQ